MLMRATWITAALLLLQPVCAACDDGVSREGLGAAAETTTGSVPTAVADTARLPGEMDVYMDAARTAWAYVDSQYQPSTGLINSVRNYPYATTWDMASGLAALYSGHRLGLLPADEYQRRMRRVLRTLREMRLFDDIAFSKNYRTDNANVAGRDNRDTDASQRGTGWSVLDLGRLLTWLKIIEVNEPQFAEDVRAVVARIDMDRLVREGYLHGATLSDGELRQYREGRIGYEQYAARGFELWGHRADGALDLAANTRPISVLGVPLLQDQRGDGHLTSEPFILMGLEQGWPGPVKELAWRVLEAQKARYEQTGQVTIVSEDAIPVEPYYFFYYSLSEHGQEFPVAVQGSDELLDDPRWISAKAAFAWHSLLPGPYTWTALQAVQAAANPARGWGSGVFEGSGEPTGNENLNTAAVILESALYYLTGRPLISGA